MLVEAHMPRPTTRSRRAAEGTTIESKTFLTDPKVQGRIQKRKKAERTRSAASRLEAEKKARMVVAMCEKLHRSGHRFLARVLQAALKDELDIKAEGVSTRVEGLDA